jgi:hypothetical protein
MHFSLAAQPAPGPPGSKGATLAVLAKSRDRRWPSPPARPSPTRTASRAMQARAAIIDEALADWPADDRDALTSLMTRLASSIDRLPAETETR